MCTRFSTQVNLRCNPALGEVILSARIEGEDDLNKLSRVVKAPMVFDGVIEQAVTVL
ncbi:hypothetical protein BGZ47_002272, partial [Haplosporangium gracile]